MAHHNCHFAIRQLVTFYYVQGTKVILVTGRPNVYRPTTSLWLKDNHVLYHDLRMPLKTYPHDVCYKVEAMKDILAAYDVQLAIEDRTEIVQAYRDLGVLCLQMEDIHSAEYKARDFSSYLFQGYLANGLLAQFHQFDVQRGYIHGEVSGKLCTWGMDDGQCVLGWSAHFHISPASLRAIKIQKGIQ